MPLTSITRTIVAATAVVGLAVSVAVPADAADADAGERVAREVCATCHQLHDGSGNSVGPSFSELAAGGSVDAGVVETVLTSLPHSSMVDVSEAAYADIVAYINKAK